MSIVWVDPVECSPSTTESWVDVDLDNYVSGVSGATGVLLLLIAGTTGVMGTLSARKNGSTDARIYKLGNTAIVHAKNHECMPIGVDENNIFEINISDTTNLHVYIIGYTRSESTFFTNLQNADATSYDSWVDVNCSSYAPGAIGIYFISHCGTVDNVGLRKNGSTDARTTKAEYFTTGGLIGCDTSQIIEQYAGSANMDLAIVGYITKDVVLNTNATDVSISTTDSYVDMAALPAGATGGIYEVIASNFAYGRLTFRKNGTSIDNYLDLTHTWYFCQCDSGGIVEQKTETANNDAFLIGYFTTSAIAPIVMHQRKMQGVS
jgi:hypothetical protein